MKFKNKDMWCIEEPFSKDKIEANGSKYLIANGYMGYRGTLEEFGAEQLVALNLAGLFDRNGDSWRESVNAPNPFYTQCTVNGEKLNILEKEPLYHNQTLDFRFGIHSRKTTFKVGDAQIDISAERFLSMNNQHLAVLKYEVCSDKKVRVNVETLIDTNVWSIHGEHFSLDSKCSEDLINIYNLSTVENSVPIKVYECVSDLKNRQEITLEANVSFSFVKICGIYWGKECCNSKQDFLLAIEKTYDELLCEHKQVWDEIWENADVKIKGDDEAQKAIRYSLYHLCSIVPRNTDSCGIPARGLSGQVYKGAAFWDTEMFMLPFFNFTNPAFAKNLVNYRLNTIGGALRKAKEFGYEGAFYAWESQETGDDACTLFNVDDIFTGRPMRTYFKDKQIHVSADMVYGLWEYCTISGDYSPLVNGGLDMIYQCLLFFYSYACFKPIKNRYEILDVVGPDEYHERVNNNAFTNKMVSYTAEAFKVACEYVKKNHSEYYDNFIQKNDISWLDDFIARLYIPQPNQDGIIEQFDGYLKLEDISLDELKKRIIIPNEYLGGGNGLATTTRILKQADIIMMLNVFRADYSELIKRANWEFYEPYTEHGSSLSACAYAIVAAEIGNSDWGYKYFMKTAVVDLTGNTKQYLGPMYIGGTHPAANGGSWSTAVLGFGGVSYKNDVLDISPRLPKHWEELSFKLIWKGTQLNVVATHNGVTVTSNNSNSDINVTVYQKAIEV